MDPTNRTADAPPSLPRWIGGLPVALYAAHALEVTLQGEGVHVLWMCHLASLLVAAGLFLRSAWLD